MGGERGAFCVSYNLFMYSSVLVAERDSNEIQVWN